MAKVKLDLDPDPEVTVIGISSHVNDYRLCWSLNRTMGLSLTRRREDISEDLGGRLASFATFDHEDPDNKDRLTLVHNHCENGVLLPEQRAADYFLVMDNAAAGSRPDLLDRLRRAEFVLAAFPLPFERLRAGYKLLR
ncbi:MAG: IPExxxVDY family protein [Flavobacteriales bacterium]|nr:IPExxxVDY family protein [Flavobacteriales bacterium]